MIVFVIGLLYPPPVIVVVLDAVETRANYLALKYGYRIVVYYSTTWSVLYCTLALLVMVAIYY